MKPAINIAENENLKLEKLREEIVVYYLPECRCLGTNCEGGGRIACSR